MSREAWVEFLQWVLPRLRLEWSGFRKVRGQVIKRIRRRMSVLGVASVEEYREFLEREASEWEKLDQLCRVTISRFWRDREVFEALRVSVLPELAAGGRLELRAWSAGCASGEEPYSVVLAWKLGPAGEVPLSVLATDVDEALLERAKRGVYEPGTLRELPGDWTGELLADLKSKVEFRRADLREAPPNEVFDLILCRNLAFTYFDRALQAEVLAKLLGCLRTGGALVVGIHEHLPLEHWPGTRAIYRKITSGLIEQP